MQQGVGEVWNSGNSTINNNNNMWIRLILLVYFQLSQLVRSSVNQIPSKPKCYFSGFLQGHERCPGIAVKDEPRTFWHVPRKMAGSRMFILRQLWPLLEKVTSVLNHPERHGNTSFDKMETLRTSVEFISIRIWTTLLFFSPTKSIMSQSQNCTTTSCSTSNCLAAFTSICSATDGVEFRVSFSLNQHIKMQLMEGTALPQKFVFMRN